MPQEPFCPKKKFNPYDLTAIAKLRNSHNSSKFDSVSIRKPYESAHSRSAYDLSKRPRRKGFPTK